MDEILLVKQYLQRNKINCYKYNYALEDTVQNYSRFKAYINLSTDSKTLRIFNLKPSYEKQEVTQTG